MAAPKLRIPNVVEQFAIWNAIDKDNADGLQQIVNQKLNVNASLDELGYTGNWTPLHWAADYDSINCASLLISNFKCDINVTNKDGQTPLQLAINKNSYKVVYLLIAECNQQIFHLSQKDQDNATEMIEQYKRKHSEIIIIDKLDQDVLQNIKDAKEKGLVIKVRHSKVLFCGSSGIGKTNFINLLLQKQFEKSHKPTGVTESHQLLAKPIQVAFVGPESQCSKHAEFKLEYMDYDTQIEWLRSLLSGNYHRSQDAPLVKHDRPDSNSVVNDKSQQISSVEKEIARDDDIPRSNPPDVWNILTFLDTGGQPGFINMLPAVNSSAMITFIMLSMEDGINSLTNKVAVYGDGPKYLLDYNYLHLIKMLFSMRQTREFQIFEQLLTDKNIRGNRNSYLSLVGTKSDLCEDSVTVANEIYKKLKPIIEQTVCKSSLIGIDGKYFVPVSNCKAGTDDEDPVAAKFRSCIYEHLNKRDIYDIPIAWLILELEIQNRTKEVNVIHFDEVSKICKEHNLITDEKDIRAALKFFHYIGIFLYYSSDDPDMKQIADIVITNYQWVFKNLTEMVKAAKSDAQVTEDFKINGRLSVQVMDYINKKLEKNVSKEYFLKLLEKLVIISPTKRACTQEEYFMPCVLSTFSFGASNEQCLLTNYGNQDKGEPLLMQLVYDESDGEPVYYDDHSYKFPLGVFCCLINLLLMKNNHSRNPRFIVQWSESDKACVFNNLITLYDSTEKCYVVLIDRLVYLEVQIRQYEGCKVSESVYRKINFEITSTLKNVCDKLKLSNSDIRVGFQCSEDSEFYWIKDKYDQTMYSQSNKPKQFKESQKIWISGLKGNEIQKEGLRYTLDDLIQLTRNKIDEIDKSVLDSDKAKEIINGVKLLIMVVNSSEFYASMYYFSKSKVSKVTNNTDGTIYYVGKWHKIPTALVRLHKNGSVESKDLTEKSISLFHNLEVIVSLGVCGTTKKLGQVIVSSKIWGCGDLTITGIINIAEPGDRILKCLKNYFECWSFLCTKEEYDEYKSNAEFKPMLCGIPLIATGDFRDKSIQGVNKEAVGVEMEGVGVSLGIRNTKKRDEIEFIIVKAGCDYADKSKHKEWQPVAAMAAADFLYEQLKKCNPEQLFKCKAKKSLIDIEADFKEMINNIEKAFSDGSIDLNDVLRKLNNSFATKNKEIPLFEKNIFKDVVSIKSLFKVLGCLWNFYDHDMLAFLIDTAKCEKANKIYSEFCASSDLSAFDLLNCYCNEEILTLPGYSTLKITIEKQECTSRTIERIKSMTIDHYGLEKYAIILKKVTKGCINLEYHIPELVLSRIGTLIISTLFKEMLKNEKVIRFNGIEVKVKAIEENTSCTSSVISNEKNLIKPEELKAMVSQKFFKDITPDSVEANELRGRIQILLLTANDYEYYAALAFLKPVEGDTLFRCQHQYTGSLAKVATYTFGRFGACNAAVQMMTFQGPAAAQEVITMAANFFGPNLDAIFSVGVACGVEKKNIKFLDVLVSKSVSFYKVARHGTTDDGKLKITSRDIANLPTSNLLLQHFSNPPEWPVETSKIAKSLTETPKLHKGLFLSGDYLVDNKDFKYELLNNFAKEAIGIEMEGAGLYHDYRSHSYQILIVKAVCDFGDGKKNKDYQPTAALLAVECLHHYLSREALPKNLYDHCNKKGNTDVQPSISPSANQTDDKKKKIPKEHLKYTIDNLNNEEIKASIHRLNNNTLSQNDKESIDNVVLLLMVINQSEFLAAMHYFSRNEAKGLHYKNNFYYVGKWGKIPAALVQQGEQGITGPTGSQELTRVSIELFTNLKLIIGVGVCGTMGRLGDVIVSSQIDGCIKKKVMGELYINRSLKCRPGSNIHNFFKNSANSWSFECTKQGVEVYRAHAVLKPMLSGCDLIASGEYRDKLIASVNKEAGGVEMEGEGVVDGIEIARRKDQIEFIIAKAGCDYADESKNKEWQPVAAMAAADFVYTGLDTKIVHDWLLKLQAGESSHSTAPQQS